MRFRLYLDESGDHTYPKAPTKDVGKRYLALVGVWFPQEGSTYSDFARGLEELKRRHLPHDPDLPPIVLHRKEIMNASGPFSPLGAADRRKAFDSDLLRLIEHHRFLTVGVVIDKMAHREKYGGRAFHPYHLALDAALERYCGYLLHLGHRGDVMAESRGRTFDEELKQAHRATYEHGTFLGYMKAHEVQKALTSREIKLKPKEQNIPGLQLADVLAAAVKLDVLAEFGVLSAPQGFTGEICQVLRANGKYNQQLYDRRIKGYGMVLLPRNP